MLALLGHFLVIPGLLLMVAGFAVGITQAEKNGKQEVEQRRKAAELEKRFAKKKTDKGKRAADKAAEAGQNAEEMLFHEADQEFPEE